MLSGDFSTLLGIFGEYKFDNIRYSQAPSQISDIWNSSLIVQSASLFHEMFFEKNVETLIMEIMDTHKKWVFVWFLSSNGKLITATKILSLWKSLPILTFYPLKIILFLLKTGSFVMVLHWLYNKTCLLLS